LFGIIGSIGLDLLNKDYNRPALDTSQTTVVANRRHENYTTLSVTLPKKFTTAGVASGVTLGLEYGHIANLSNDKFYQFTDDVASLSVGVEVF